MTLDSVTADSDGVQVWLTLGPATGGTTVYDSDIATMTEAEFEEFWHNVGVVVRTMGNLRKAARARAEANANPNP